MNIFLRDDLRIDVLAGDADVDGVKTWTAGDVIRGRIEDKITLIRLPDGTESKSDLAIFTRASCAYGSRVFPAPSSSTPAGRRFPTGFAFVDKNSRTPLLIKSAFMVGFGQVTEIYF